MLILRVLFLHEWSDFYSAIANYQKLTDQTTRQTIDQNTYVLRSIFEDLSDSSGAAISFSGSNKYLLVEFSAFYLCHASTYGGCVYASQGHCVINCVCCLKCYAGSYGQSIYTELSSSSNNYVIQSSICSDDKTTGNLETICLDNGDQNCSSVNLSKNNVKRYSAIYFDFGSSNPSIAEYCSLNTNVASEYACVGIWSDGQSYRIAKSNIINNTQDTNDCGTFRCLKPTEIIDCCILENSGQVDDYNLFYCSGSITITVTHCTLSSTFTTTGNVNLENARTSDAFIYGFHMTQDGTYCQSGLLIHLPLVIDPLTPLPPSSTPLPTASPCVCRYTCHQKNLILYRAASVGASSIFIAGIS